MVWEGGAGQKRAHSCMDRVSRSGTEGPAMVCLGVRRRTETCSRDEMGLPRRLCARMWIGGCRVPLVWEGGVPPQACRTSDERLKQDAVPRPGCNRW